MENKYNLRDVTPKKMACLISACPSIYEAREVTPKNMRCAAGPCQGIYQTEDSYLIVGEQINPAEAGLEEKVGKGEVLIKVPKALIDEKQD